MMAINLGKSEVSDTILVGGEEVSDDSPISSIGGLDNSDALGEEGHNLKKSELLPLGMGNDASPKCDPDQRSDPDGDGSKSLAQLPVVSEEAPSAAAVTMHSSPAPGVMTSQSPAAPDLSALPTEMSHSDGANSDAQGSILPVDSAASAPSPAPASASAPAPTSNGPIESPSASSPADLSAAEQMTQDKDQTHAPSHKSPDEHESDEAIDVQKLVDDITARAAGASTTSTSLTSQPPPSTSVSTLVAPTSTLSPSSSLPPKPNIPAQKPVKPVVQPVSYSQDFAFPNSATTPRTPGAAAGHAPTTGRSGNHSGGLSGSNDGRASLPPPPPVSFGMSQSYGSHPGAALAPASHQAWEAFQADERKFMTDAKWERFPEGSRVFIGNLSSDRVSKREIFDLFHHFGRLAQISLKSAYGFVQYHNVDEAQAAMRNAEGVEMGGRKIHLEVSRTQKRKDDRDRSPAGERKSSNRAGRGDRYDGREQTRRNRDEFRPRSPSPRRQESRGSRDLHGRDWDRDFRSSTERRDRRSRSPPRFDRSEDNQYRRRSPSPRRTLTTNGTNEFDTPRRYGSAVPDVQFVAVPDLQPDFLEWIRRAFNERNLRTDVFLVNPRYHREDFIQRQIIEGVVGIVDLDYRAQSTGKISIQVFNRSGGPSVRFDRYEDVDPSIAAELVIREKNKGVYPPPALASQLPQQPPPTQTYQANNYTGYANYYAPPTSGAGYTYPAAQSSAVHGQTPAVVQATPDLANMLGQLLPVAKGGQNSTSIDLKALLGSLQNGAGVGAASAAGGLGQANPGAEAVGYGTAPPHHGSAYGSYHPDMNGAGGGDGNSTVRALMEQLTHFRQ